MTQEVRTPPSEPPSEENIREFEKKFNDFFNTLSEGEKLQAASLVTLATSEDPTDPEQTGGANPATEQLSSDEVEGFFAKLTQFHDSLPEGQHQILDSLCARGFHESQEEKQDEDVQGNIWLWTRYISFSGYSSQWHEYYRRYCANQGGVLYNLGFSGMGYYVGCWRW